VSDRRKGQHYSDEQREEAVRAYLALGSYEKAAQVVGMTKEAIAVWRHRHPDQWEEIVQKVQCQMEEQYRAGWRGVLSNALDVMQDRLANGNHKPVRGEDGEYKMLRVPVEAKDAIVIAGIAADKLRVSLGLPNRITGKVQDNDRLEELRKLAAASRAARDKSEPSDPPTIQ